jgi:hypothetical protein
MHRLALLVVFVMSSFGCASLGLDPMQSTKFRNIDGVLVDDKESWCTYYDRMKRNADTWKFGISTVTGASGLTGLATGLGGLAFTSDRDKANLLTVASIAAGAATTASSVLLFYYSAVWDDNDKYAGRVGCTVSGE